MPAPRLVYPRTESSSLSGPRMLLISYHFPPSEATGGVRWQAFATEAVADGWGVDVIALDPADAQLTDDRRLESLPDGIRVYAVREESELPLDRIARRVRDTGRTVARTLVPDLPTNAGESADTEIGSDRPRTYPRDSIPSVLSDPATVLRAYRGWREHALGKRWARRAAGAGLDEVVPGIHRVVVSSGPPHLAHWGAARIARRAELPLVLDFRDAWSVSEVWSEERASWLTLKLASDCEARCIRQAGLVVANTEPLRARMRAEYPDAECRFVSVPNGFDASAVRSVRSRSRFIIAYAGSIYFNRDPTVLMQAVAVLVQKLDLTPEELSIEFMGHVESLGGVPVRSMAENEGIGEFLRLHPPASRQAAMEFLERGSVLVSLPQELEMAIPSKIFDYMQFDAWIVAQARQSSASGQLLSSTRAAVVEPDDVEGLARVLEDRYRQHAAGQRPAPLAREHPELSRTEQARRLLGKMEQWKR